MLATLVALALTAAPPLPAPFDSLVAVQVPDREKFIYVPAGSFKTLSSSSSASPNGTPVLEVRLAPKRPPVCVAFSDGPSEDPTFLIYPRAACAHAPGHPGEELPLLEVTATSLIVPGNGFLYSAGFTDNYFDARHKYEVLANGKLREVAQPFFAVGKRVRVARPTPETPGAITLLGARADDAPVVASVAEGAEVEVLLSDSPTSGWFLVRTAFGLVGWYHHTLGQRTDALGLYFNGD